MNWQHLYENEIKNWEEISEENFKSLIFYFDDFDNEEDKDQVLQFIKDNIDKIKEIKSSMLEDTPLHIASRLASYKIVKILLENGIDPNTEDKNSRTPIHSIVSATWHNKKIEDIKKTIDLLLEYGADLNAKDKYGNTLLDEVIDKYILHRQEMVEYLLERGAYPSIDFLKLANKPDLLKIFKKYIDLSAKDDKGNTLLHYAVKHKNESSISFLLEEGLSPNTVNNEGDTPLHILFANFKPDKLLYSKEDLDKNIRIAEMLLEKGADINIKNNYGKTPISLLEESLTTDLNEGNISYKDIQYVNKVIDLLKKYKVAKEGSVKIVIETKENEKSLDR